MSRCKHCSKGSQVPAWLMRTHRQRGLGGAPERVLPVPAVPLALFYGHWGGVSLPSRPEVFQALPLCSRSHVTPPQEG